AALLAGGWLLSLDARLGLSVLGPLLLAAALPWLARVRAAELAREEARVAREHGAALLDALSASADGAARLWAPRLDALNGQLRRVTRAQGHLQTGLTLGREALFALSFTLVLTRGLALVEVGALGGAWLAAVVLLAAASFDALTPLALVPGAHAAAQAAQERDAELSDVQPAVTDPDHPLALPPGPVPLTLDGVGLTRGGRELLRGVTLPLPPGARVAVTGPSGAGKSTLLGLISRDLDPTAGRVTLGGTDLRALALADLRARLSLHEQDAPLLDGTVEENLRLGDPHAPPGRLRALLDDLGLADLPLDTWVGEGGTRLSGGQRARVSLARALLKRSDVLLLDEPTAHLDPDTEARVLRVLGRECAGRTLLLVTHRPAPLALADQVYRLQDGHLHPLPATRKKVI
ncbi:ATP-binding cassette domain-containing protein, partial [Deinococcus xianganensis]